MTAVRSSHSIASSGDTVGLEYRRENVNPRNPCGGLRSVAFWRVSLVSFSVRLIRPPLSTTLQSHGRYAGSPLFLAASLVTFDLLPRVLPRKVRVKKKPQDLVPRARRTLKCSGLLLAAARGFPARKRLSCGHR